MYLYVCICHTYMQLHRYVCLSNCLCVCVWTNNIHTSTGIEAKSADPANVGRRLGQAVGLVGMGDIPICRNRTTPTALRLVSVVSGGQKICCFPFFFSVVGSCSLCWRGRIPGSGGVSCAVREPLCLSCPPLSLRFMYWKYAEMQKKREERATRERERVSEGAENSI